MIAVETSPISIWRNAFLGQARASNPREDGVVRASAFRRIILADTPPLTGVIWTAVAIVVPTVLRWLIDRGETGIPFVTYFPAIVLAALFLGWKYGAATALLSGFIANRVFREAPVLFYAGARQALFVLLYALTCVILIAIAEMLRRLVREQARAARREAQLNAELVHRVKNMLATVNSIASLSARHSRPDEFVDAFSGRVAALGKATDLLGSGYDMACELKQLAEAVIAPFRDEDNFTLAGPPCNISREACVPLALALHELCTNALKYGALSAPGGRVSLEWAIEEAPGYQVLISWREIGGPPVGAIEHEGMGMALLRPQAGLADVHVDFPPDGATCEIVLDLPHET
jgi:two-component sensor histidine kinase